MYSIIAADIILNVTGMKKVGTVIGDQVTIVEIEKAMHDVFLSKQSARENAFEQMFSWLKRVENGWIVEENK